MSAHSVSLSTSPAASLETSKELPNMPSSASDLHALPAGYLPFEEFTQKFSLGEASTEKTHEKTVFLSQTMQSDVVAGLKMLCDADQAVLVGFERFIPEIASLAPELATSMQAGGRIFLVGSGSSGRVAVDIAAKCNKEEIVGVIAGGDSALIRAKEGFEDSELDGEKCLQPFNLTAKDTVILISASGSASFNVGCGNFAANMGSSVFYFYNSQTIPSRTQKLFCRTNNPIKPLELDIGPQAISGSTRLQAASLAEMCLGALLAAALLHLEESASDTILLTLEERVSDATIYPKDLLEKMSTANALIVNNLETIAQFVQKEAAIFLSSDANLRRFQDETSQGYVTIIGEKNSLREILIDATETSPTFSTSPIRRESELSQKREEFRAYLVGETDNQAAWEALLGRGLASDALADTKQFLLAAEADGNHSYNKRPTGTGNFVIGVMKRADASEESHAVLDLLNSAISQGGDAGMIILSRDTAPSFSNSSILTLPLENVPFDHFGIVETLLLKHILNLISNGAMVLTGKVHGNQMIDVRTSNNKLIDRAIRLIKDIWKDSKALMPLTDEELYSYVAHVDTLKKSYTKSGMYTPSVVKIVLALIHLQEKATPEGFQKAVDFLAATQELLDFLKPEKPLS